jgi:putative transposase
VVTPAARREATTYLRQSFEMSERRACRVIGTDRTSVRYQAFDRTTWRCASG